MRSHRVYVWLWLALFLSSIVFFAWGSWPPAHVVRRVKVASWTDQNAFKTLPANRLLPHFHTLTVKWPASLRSGDISQIQLQLDLDEGEYAQLENGSWTETVDNPIWMLEARLDIPGVIFAPSGSISQAVVAGRPITFIWQVQPQAADFYRGAIWLYLRQEPIPGGDSVRIPLTAQQVDIRVVELFGLSGGSARAAGALGIGCCGLAGWRGWAAHRSTAQHHDSTNPTRSG